MSAEEIFWTDEDYEYEEIQERAKIRNRIKRLEETSFSIQHEIWLFFSISWFKLLSEVRDTQQITYSNLTTFIDSIGKKITNPEYGAFTNDELKRISKSIGKDNRLSSNLGERKSKLFDRKNEVYSFDLGEKYNQNFLPYHKAIKALVLTWTHEVAYRECRSVPVWNYITFYYTCVGFASTLSRSLDTTIGKIDGHKHLWSLYGSNVLQNKAVRENLASPLSEYFNKEYYGEIKNQYSNIEDIVPFIAIIHGFQTPLFSEIDRNLKEKEKGHFFHFIHYFSEYFRYKNILPVLFSKNPKYSFAEIQLTGMCDYMMIWLESLLIRLLSPELIEFFMYNFICRNEKALCLKERYKIYQDNGYFPQKRKGKIPYGGHEILDELIRIKR